MTGQRIVASVEFDDDHCFIRFEIAVPEKVINRLF